MCQVNGPREWVGCPKCGKGFYQDHFNQEHPNCPAAPMTKPAEPQAVPILERWIFDQDADGNNTITAADGTQLLWENNYEAAINLSDEQWVDVANMPLMKARIAHLEAQLRDAERKLDKAEGRIGLLRCEVSEAERKGWNEAIDAACTIAWIEDALDLPNAIRALARGPVQGEDSKHVNK